MTREIFAKRGWLELAQTSLSPRGTKPGIGLISRRSDRRRIGFRPPAAIAIIRTVAVLSPRKAGECIELALRLRRTPFPGSLIPVPRLYQIRPRVGCAELARRSRVESLGQEKGSAGIVGVRCTCQKQARSLQIAARQEFLRPPDKGRDFIGTQLPDRLRGRLWCGHGRCGRWRRCNGLRLRNGQRLLWRRRDGGGR